MIRFLAMGCRMDVVRRAAVVALVVGTLLNLINHYEIALGAMVDAKTVVQVLLTYLVPYFVSTHGQVIAMACDGETSTGGNAPSMTSGGDTG